MTNNMALTKDVSVEIVSEFLQSVVIVDDGADFRPSEHRPSGMSETPPAQTTGKRVRFPKPRLTTPPTASVVNENVLDAKLVADGFAERGIVCSILMPAQDEDPSERTLRVARRADILVLDWDFYGDNGEIARRLLRDVAGDDERDNRRRLIAIYTAEPDLDAIMAGVREERERSKASRVKSRGRYTLDDRVMRVIVLAKPETRIPANLRRARRQIVQYEKLPEVLINEFSSFMYGLVSNVALKAVAALRSNTHQLLKQLGPHLDAGYLWHRAVQTFPEDAEQHVVDLVAAEFRGILDDCDVRDAASLTAIRQWLEKLEIGNFAPRFGETGQRSIEDVMELLQFGSAANTAAASHVIEKFPNMKAKSAHRKSEPIPAFAESKAAAARSNEAFAILASHRTQYSRPRPHLTLGTVISSGSGKRRRYWLCLQPVCDAVRLTAARRFPFLELRQADSGKAFQFVLRAGTRKSVRLSIDVTPQAITMLEFYPTTGYDCVVAEEKNSRFFFIRGKRRYRWEAELKPEHAQRFVENLAREFSRVGLVESEWLRLWGRAS